MFVGEPEQIAAVQILLRQNLRPELQPLGAVDCRPQGASLRCVNPRLSSADDFVPPASPPKPIDSWVALDGLTGAHPAMARGLEWCLTGGPDPAVWRPLVGAVVGDVVILTTSDIPSTGSESSRHAALRAAARRQLPAHRTPNAVLRQLWRGERNDPTVAAALRRARSASLLEETGSSWPALYHAAVAANEHTFRQLLEAGADPLQTPVSGPLPLGLMDVVLDGLRQLPTPQQAARVRIARLALQAHPALGRRLLLSGISPRYATIIAGHPGAARVLAKCQTLRRPDAETLCHGEAAARHPEVIPALLEGGIDPTPQFLQEVAHAISTGVCDDDAAAWSSAASCLVDHPDMTSTLLARIDLTPIADVRAVFKAALAFKHLTERTTPSVQPL